jgi:hypothetical protein
MRIEPPPSLAWAIGTAPDATNTADPAEEAPDEWPVCQGLRTGSAFMNSALALNPNSESWDLPRLTSPWPRNIVAKSPSARAGRATYAGQPCWVGSPSTSELSLTRVGTPVKKRSPGFAARARSLARSKSAQASPLSSGCSSSSRAIAASTASSGETRPSRISAARPTASCSPRASSVKACTRVRVGVWVMGRRYPALDRTRIRPWSDVWSRASRSGVSPDSTGRFTQLNG